MQLMELQIEMNEKLNSTVDLHNRGGELLLFKFLCNCSLIGLVCLY